MNRAAALRDVPDLAGLSRDEFPFASAMEGGEGAWVGHSCATAACARRADQELPSGKRSRAGDAVSCGGHPMTKE